VSVNGTVVTELGTKVEANLDQIVVNGRPLPKLHRRYYIALNKPRGVVSAVSDPHGAKTVTSLVDLQSKPLLRPVGRLDMDSEGLIFLTDDGDFLNKLTHPSHQVGKTYAVQVTGTPSDEALQLIASGVKLEDGKTRPAKYVKRGRTFRGEEEGSERTEVELTIFEGRNRQVRRMFDAVGHPVQRLSRIAIGPVRLSGLPSGAWRHLTPKEVEMLVSSAANAVEKTKEPKWQTEQSRSKPTRASSSRPSSKPRRPSQRPTSSN